MFSTNILGNIRVRTETSSPDAHAHQPRNVITWGIHACLSEPIQKSVNPCFRQKSIRAR